MTMENNNNDELPSFQAGDVVLTAYGVGVIVSGKENDFYRVRLWRIPGRSMGSSALALLQPSAIKSRLPVAPGMMTTLKNLHKTDTETATSEKVVVPPPANTPEVEPSVTASEAETKTASQAETKTPLLRVLVHCYYEHENSYLISSVPFESKKGALLSKEEEEEDAISEEGSALSLKPRSTLLSRSNSSGGLPPTTAFSEQQQPALQLQLQRVAADQVEPAACAKFYPVLEILMLRADHTVSATTKLLENEKTQRIMDQTSRAIQERTDQLATSGPTVATEKLESLASAVEVAAPRAEEQMKEALNMIRDGELTVLLEQGKKRLEQLVQKDLPQATKHALAKTGIRLQTEDPASVFSESTEASRKAALSALERLLKQAELDPSDLSKIRGDLAKNFTTAFDSLATAAKSDRSLDAIFESVSEKTTVWQEVTGRLMQTRSASLFMEGATRLQARAAAILGQNQIQWAGEIGSKLTKSFTEGDAALAKLKSIELGDVVKSRLVEAIEVRSESLGGLDGIIAGALTTVRSKSAESGGQMNKMLTNLQQTASRKTADAHETLISVLSSRSLYRDVALLRIEGVMCDLEAQFGDELSPEAIASIARGEGGTAKLFEPIARRALKEIEKQLDVAEKQITDNTVLEVLKRVRKIMSGELSISAVMDEVVNMLNNEKVVAAGESLVQHSEHVLDAIEGASGNKAMTDAIQIAEKAGITKDAVMREFEKLNMNELIDTAGNAVTDEKARQKLLSSATDVALDFFLRILPSMPVPPFEGVKDGLVYHISNLSMKGFKVRKEDIQISLAGMRATKKGRKSTPQSQPVNEETSPGALEAGAVEIHSSVSMGSVESSDTLQFEEIAGTVKATELLIIDIRGISALFDNAAWSFEQTYLPYLKGNGLANVKMSDGSIRLQFELRRQLKQSEGSSDAEGAEPVWEPVLCLHDRSCSIEEVELSLHGEGRLTWIFNKLAATFKGPLRDYVVKTIVRLLTNRSGWILDRLNKILTPYWDLILRTAKLNMDDLVVADDAVVVKEEASPTYNLVELVWRERLPLGMNLLLNDDSGLLKVVDFPRGSQARIVCEKRQLDPDVFKGARVVAVNGFEYDDQEELFNALKEPSRPKTVRFQLAESEDAERLRQFVERASDLEKSYANDVVTERSFNLRKVNFTEPGELGIEFGNALDNTGLVVTGFIEGDSGTVLAAERSGEVREGELLTHINGELVVGLEGNGRSRALELLESVAEHRPLVLTFAAPYLHREVIERPTPIPGVDGGSTSAEIILGERKLTNGARRIGVQGFEAVGGAVESSGILLGDHLVFINGKPVGAGCRWLGEGLPPSLGEVHAMLQNESLYPIGLTFARPRQRDSAWKSHFSATKEFSDDEAETVCVTADHPAELGCILDVANTNDIVVKNFCAVPGPFQCALDKYKDPNTLQMHVSIESLNGQFVPSYASKDMVKNALARSWKNEKRVEIWLCDDDRKAWVHSQLRTSGDAIN